MENNYKVEIFLSDTGVFSFKFNCLIPTELHSLICSLEESCGIKFTRKIKEEFFYFGFFKKKLTKENFLRKIISLLLEEFDKKEIKISYQSTVTVELGCLI